MEQVVAHRLPYSPRSYLSGTKHIEPYPGGQKLQAEKGKVMKAAKSSSGSSIAHLAAGVANAVDDPGDQPGHAHGCRQLGIFDPGDHQASQEWRVVIDMIGVRTLGAIEGISLGITGRLLGRAIGIRIRQLGGTPEGTDTNDKPVGEEDRGSRGQQHVSDQGGDTSVQVLVGLRIEEEEPRLTHSRSTGLARTTWR